MDGVEGEVEEERVGLVAFDEADRFAGEGVGEVGVSCWPAGWVLRRMPLGLK